MGLAVWQRRKKVKNGHPGLVHILWEGKKNIRTEQLRQLKIISKIWFPTVTIAQIRNNYRTNKQKKSWLLEDGRY